MDGSVMSGIDTCEIGWPVAEIHFAVYLNITDCLPADSSNPII